MEYTGYTCNKSLIARRRERRRKEERVCAWRKTLEEKEAISGKNKGVEMREGITATRGKRGKGTGERLTAKRGWRFYSEGGWFWRLVTAVGCRKRGWRGGEEDENPRGVWSRSRRVFRRLNQLKRKNSRGKIFETCPARRARPHIHACSFVRTDREIDGTVCLSDCQVSRDPVFRDLRVKILM